MSQPLNDGFKLPQLGSSILLTAQNAISAKNTLKSSGSHVVNRSSSIAQFSQLGGDNSSEEDRMILQISSKIENRKKQMSTFQPIKVQIQAQAQYVQTLVQQFDYINEKCKDLYIRMMKLFQQQQSNFKDLGIGGM